MLQLSSELNRAILAVFNEYGIQIMTPSYEGDPPDAKLVPKDQWYAPPAKPPKSEEKPESSDDTAGPRGGEGAPTGS